LELATEITEGTEEDDEIGTMNDETIDQFAHLVIDSLKEWINEPISQ
jgi:hypothetical protein